MVFSKTHLPVRRIYVMACHLSCKHVLLFFCVSLTLQQIITAQRTTSPDDGDVRLSDGRTPFEGRVEVYYNGEWGTICDDDWGYEDASVICKQLGYTNRASRFDCCLSFGPGLGPIHLDEVGCSGDESNIKDCMANVWGRNNCGHWEDAGVVCGSPIRLADGRTSLDGRVEIFMNGNWGTICNTDWSIEDSTVICVMLGGYTASNYTAQVTHGSGPVHLDSVQCDGTETSLEQCLKSSVVGIACMSHQLDVGVNCSRQIRLVNGTHPLEGRLEVHYNNKWGTVCDDDFSSAAAEVVCRNMGNYGVDFRKAYSCCALFGKGSGKILLNNLVCTGQEKGIEDCSFQSINRNCGHTEDVSVHCSDLRLTDENKDLQGKLEFVEDQRWGEICADQWDKKDAQVACQQLFNTDAVAPYFIETRTPVTPLHGGFQCNGTEARLSDCPRTSYSTCPHMRVAGIWCKELMKLRLRDGSNSMEGRVEIYFNKKWGTVCDDGWSIEEAAVVCKQLGNFDVRAAKCCSAFSSGSGVILLDDVYCRGDEMRLEECAHNPWEDHNCGHHEDASVVCSGTYSTISNSR